MNHPIQTTRRTRTWKWTVPAFCAAAGLALIGCGTGRVSLSDPPARELAGHFVSTPKENWFTPCNASPGDGAWWATVTGGAVQSIDAARAAGRLEPGRNYFVRWNAVVVTDGRVGPRGPGQPALLVREVLELREATETDCSAAGP